MEFYIIIMLIIAGFIGLGIYVKSAIEKSQRENQDLIRISQINSNNLPEVRSDIIYSGYSNVDISDDIKPNELVLGDSESPDIRIRRLESNEKSVPIIASNEIKSFISAILQQAPTLLVNSSKFLDKSFLLVFKPEVIQGLQNGNYQIMKSLEGGFRPIVTDGKKIVAQGRLKINTGTNITVAATIIWQILAIITAQKFLADIDKKLVRIENLVHSIYEHFKYQRIGSLKGKLEYMKNITEIENQQFNYNEIQAYLHQIESIKLDCLEIMEASSLEEQNTVIRLVNLTFNGNENETNEAEKYVEEIVGLHKEYLLALYVYSAALQTQFILPFEKINTKNAMKSLNAKLDKEISDFNSFEQSLRNKLAEVRGDYSKDRQRKIMRNVINIAIEEVKDLSPEVKNVISDLGIILHKFNNEIGRPISLVAVTNHKGQVQELRRLKEKI